MAEVLRVFLENEAGSLTKNLHDERALTHTGGMQVSRPYPFPYGFLLDTTNEDGDNLDCFVLTRADLRRGSIVGGKYARDKPAPTNTRLSPADSPLRGRFLSDDKLARAEALAQLAEARGHTLLELAFSWLAARAAVSSIIAGATSEEQVRANAAATGWQLSEDELREIDRLAPASSA
jgi:hypothetical protein